MQLSLAIDARFYRCDVVLVSFFSLSFFLFGSFSRFFSLLSNQPELSFASSIDYQPTTYQPVVNIDKHRSILSPPIDIHAYILSILRRGEPCSPCTKINFSCCRWTSVQVPSTGLRAGVHSIIEFAATPSESRRPGGTGEEPAVPLQHLRQRLRHRIQPSYPHVEGQSCMYQIRRPTTTGILAT